MQLFQRAASVTTSIVTDSHAVHHYMLFGNAETRQSSHRAADLSCRFVGAGRGTYCRAGGAGDQTSIPGRRMPAAPCAAVIACMLMGMGLHQIKSKDKTAVSAPARSRRR